MKRHEKVAAGQVNGFWGVVTNLWWADSCERPCWPRLAIFFTLQRDHFLKSTIIRILVMCRAEKYKLKFKHWKTRLARWLKVAMHVKLERDPLRQKDLCI